MQESPIFVRTFDLLLWLLPFTQKFPKEQHFVLASRVPEDGASSPGQDEHVLEMVEALSKRPANFKIT